MLLKNISQIFLQRRGLLISKLRQTAQGAVLSVSDIRVPELCEGGSPVGARITPSLLSTLPKPSPVYPCRNEGERRLPNRPASRPSTKELSGASLPHRKNVKRLTYEATPDSATVKKLCFQPAQAHPPGAVPPHPYLVEPQAPLHAHHTERKTKTYVFEVG